MSKSLRPADARLRLQRCDVNTQLSTFRGWIESLADREIWIEDLKDGMRLHVADWCVDLQQREQKNRKFRRFRSGVNLYGIPRHDQLESYSELVTVLGPALELLRDYFESHPLPEMEDEPPVAPETAPMMRTEVTVNLPIHGDQQQKPPYDPNTARAKFLAEYEEFCESRKPNRTGPNDWFSVFEQWSKNSKDYFESLCSQNDAKGSEKRPLEIVATAIETERTARRRAN